MDRITIDTSSEEDDPYTNFAARLRALKKKRVEMDAKRETFTKIEQQTNNEMNKEEANDIEIINNGIQTRSRTLVKRRGRRTRERHQPVDNRQCDMEIVSVEEKRILIPESCKNDVILLSDDNSCSEDENYEIYIKIFWKSNRIDRFSMHRHDSFQKVFQHYADLEKVSVNEVLIMKNDRVVKCTDTPVSLNLCILDILDGGIVNPGMNVSKDKNNDDDNMCNIKVQTANRKQSLNILLRRDQQFKALFASCAEQLGVKENSLKLYFDGEQINLTDTPESLDLEGEACVDLHIYS